MRREIPGGALKFHESTVGLPALLSPATLGAQHIQVAQVLQQPGEFVVTMPAAFHCSVSHGFNCSEQVSFASIEWLPWGRRAATMHALLQSTPQLHFEELILRASQSDETVRGAVFLHAQVRLRKRLRPT